MMTATVIAPAALADFSRRLNEEARRIDAGDLTDLNHALRGEAARLGGPKSGKKSADFPLAIQYRLPQAIEQGRARGYTPAVAARFRDDIVRQRQARTATEGRNLEDVHQVFETGFDGGRM